MEIIKIKEQSINASKLYKKMLDSLGVEAFRKFGYELN